MKIYEVREDNGEIWEDHYSYPLDFFASLEGAIKYLQEENGRVLDKERNVWVLKKGQCTDTSDEKCLGCGFYDKTSELDYIDIDKDYYHCDQYDDRFEEQYDFSYCEIIEHELRD